MSMNIYKIIYILLSAIILSGCSSYFGPNALKQTHPAYNNAITNSIDQEMLLNLVRLRYRDSTYFLQIASVTASLSLQSSASVNSSIDLGPDGNVISPGVGIAYADQPTISYTPLQGEAFLKSVLTPISLEAILVMIQSGWSVERVFGLCIERMNDLYNAPRASGPTPESEPEYKEFKRMLELFREFQLNGDLEIGPSYNTEFESNDLIMLFEKENINQASLRELGDLLRGNKELSAQHADADRVRISTNFIDRQEDQLTVRTRSISSLLFYLSQNVDIPAEHSNAGLVTISKNNHGAPFDWSDTPAGSVFNVRSSEEKPENSMLAVPYRGYWYYIADDDLKSKSTFLLLMQLFNLQAGQNSSEGPTLTIPVTR
jgi:hypothetical protein